MLCTPTWDVLYKSACRARAHSVWKIFYHGVSHDQQRHKCISPLYAYIGAEIKKNDHCPQAL